MTDFTLPHPLRNRTGEVRKVGVELEFGGLSLPEAAGAVRDAFDGQLRQDHEHRYTVTVPSLGEFEVTFDSSLLSNKRHEQVVEHLGVPLGDTVKGAVETVLRTVGDTILPLEVSTPPLPVTRLAEVEKLERALRDQHAQGTRQGLLYAFALHFNPEAPDPTDPACLLNTLRAFLLLYEWLFRKAEVDWTRRLLPFIDPFPESFARHVLDPGYAPDMPTFINDYVQANPTRNRPLDLLPLLALNDPGLTKRPPLEGHKIKPRPAFHYRLPNSLIDDPGWSIAREWDQWLLVERLAGRPDLLGPLARTYLDWDGTLVGYLTDSWVKHLDAEWVPKLREPPAE